MPSLFDIGKSGLQAYRQSLAVTGQNIANINTDGYKKREASLEEVTGAGGGVTGQDGQSPYNDKWQYRGRGGSGNEGGRNNQQGTDYAARALEGGTANSNGYGGAGGGGYYGGSNGGYSEQHTMAGGGGGSGYANPTYCRNVRNHRGEYRMPAGAGESGYPGGGISYGGNANATAGGHGYCRITDANGTVTTYSYTGSDATITVP